MEDAGGSVKGVVAERAVERVRALEAAGEIGRDELELRLEPEELALLDEKLEPTLLYSVDAVAGLYELLVARSDRPRAELLREFGIENSRVVHHKHAVGFFIEEASKRRSGVPELLARVPTLLYDFGEWSCTQQPNGSLRVEARDVAQLPDAFRYLMEGSMLALAAELSATAAHVESTRPEPATIVFEVRFP